MKQPWLAPSRRLFRSQISDILWLVLIELGTGQIIAEENAIALAAFVVSGDVKGGRL